MQFLEKLQKCQKTQRYQTGHNRRKKLFGARTKYYTTKFFMKINEKNADTEKTSLFRTFNTGITKIFNV